MINLETIKARCEAATPGPWKVQGNKVFTTRSDPDAELAAHAREDIPRLIAEIEQLRDSVILAGEAIYAERVEWQTKVNQLQDKLGKAELAIHVHTRSLDEHTTTNWRLEAEIERLRASLEVVLEEATSDLDRDIIVTECESALRRNE